jgi:hypothetical protein
MRNPSKKFIPPTLIFFAEAAKRRGFTIKVDGSSPLGAYSFKKSRRYDSPQLRFTKCRPDGITVTEFHPRTKKSKVITVRFEEFGYASDT